MTDLKLEDFLDKKIIDILDENYISYSLCGERNGELCAELEFSSDYDGDQVFAIWFDKEDADESFCDGFRDYYEGFDIDEYVEMYLEAHRSNPTGYPYGARILVKDAEGIEDFLEKVTLQLFAVKNDLVYC